MLKAYTANFLLCFVLVSLTSAAQHLQLLTQGTVSFRGLSVVSDQIVWVSGSEGTVGLSTNGGATWKWMHVPRYEKSDFRDIEAFNDREAVIMGITDPAVILSTKDAGVSWQTVFEDSSKSAFLDAMDFSGDHGVVVGDPVAGKIFFAESAYKGERWSVSPDSRLPPTAEGESFFCSKWIKRSIHYG